MKSVFYYYFAVLNYTCIIVFFVNLQCTFPFENVFNAMATINVYMYTWV